MYYDFAFDFLVWVNDILRLPPRRLTCLDQFIEVGILYLYHMGGISRVASEHTLVARYF